MIPITGLAFLMAATSLPGEVAVPPAPDVELALGHRVVGRTLERADEDEVFFAGDTIVAWTAVSGLSSGFVEHVWYRDGVEVARHYLPVGAGRRWRTWTRHTVSAGEYTIQVLGPDGALLRETRFAVEGEGC